MNLFIENKCLVEGKFLEVNIPKLTFTKSIKTLFEEQDVIKYKILIGQENRGEAKLSLKTYGVISAQPNEANLSIVYIDNFRKTLMD